MEVNIEIEVLLSMCNKIIELEDYKNKEEKKLKEALEYFEGVDLSLENYINITEKLKETKDIDIIKEIPINDLDIKKIACKINKKIKK